MAVGAVFALALINAAPAAALDLYVDHDVAVTTDPACPALAPCKTIVEAVALADVSDASTDIVHVGLGSTYPESVTVPDTPVTLLGGEYNFTGTGTQSVIDGGTEPAITLAFGELPRTVRGLTLQGGVAGLTDDTTLEGAASGGVTIENNIFNETGPIDAFISLGGSPTIRGNTMVGFDHPGQWSNGIGMNSAIAPRIENNSISGVERSITIFGSTQQVTITGNTLEPTGDDAPSTPGGFGIGLGNGAGGEISGNLITAALFSPPDATAAGISLTSDGPGTRRLARNRIFGFPGSGVWVETVDPVTLDGDVIAANGGVGIRNTTTATSITASNVTLWGNDTVGTAGEIRAGATTSVALDSSIVGDDGVQVAGGTPTCSATFSRGPAVSALCGGQFSTAAAPSFVNAAARDFHLTPAGNAALIDTGNPAAPASAFDLDGQPRALDALADSICAPRRDVGADEVSIPNSDCLTTSPPATAPKRCPEGKKLKKVKTKKGKKKKKCVKKKRKKKRKN
jgi:hypothetical protein